jgi:hypothetical protein
MAAAQIFIAPAAINKESCRADPLRYHTWLSINLFGRVDGDCDAASVETSRTALVQWHNSWCRDKPFQAQSHPLTGSAVIAEG